MAKVRIGLIGAGVVAGFHLDAYRQLFDVATVVAVADPYAKSAQSRASEYGIGAVYSDAKSMMDDQYLDAVDIAAPREMHAELCLLAAERGLGVLCQKPLAPTLDEARKLAAALPPRARIMVHENWRFRPHYRLIRRWLDEDRIGKLRHAEMYAVASGLLPDTEGNIPALIRQPMLVGLERMMVTEMLIHQLDTLRFLLGPLSFVGSVSGKTSQAILGEDRASLLLATDRQAAVTLIGDFMSHGAPPTLSDSLHLSGEKGGIRFSSRSLSVTGDQPEEIAVDLAADYKASYRDAIAHFIEHFVGDGLFETSVGDNLHTLALVERAYQRELV